MSTNSDSPIEVFAGEPWQASMLKEILEDNNIHVFLQNEHMASIAPWYVAPGVLNPAKLIVSAQDYESALKIIAEFNNQPGITEED